MKRSVVVCVDLHETCPLADLHAANAFSESFIVLGGKQQAGALIMRIGLLEARRGPISEPHDHKMLHPWGEPESSFLAQAQHDLQ